MKSEKRPPEYFAWAKAVKARDQYTCQDCGQKDRRKLHAHHIKGWTSHPHLRYELDNGLTLCVKCHANRHPKQRRLLLGKANKKMRRLNKKIRVLNKSKRTDNKWLSN